MRTRPSRSPTTSDFGLGGSVFTKDIARGKRVASRVETGMMFINNIDWSDAELPFGGIKNSGYGRELGDMGIQEFVNKKLVACRSTSGRWTVAKALPAWLPSGKAGVLDVRQRRRSEGNTAARTARGAGAFRRRPS